MEKPTIQHLRGVLIISVIAGLAYAIAAITDFLSPVIYGIILGMIGGNTIGSNEKSAPGIKFTEKTVLAYAIILMGIPTGASMHSGAPWEAALIVIAVMTFTLISGLSLYRLFGLSKEDGLLMGVGNAVCGASAIAAISGIVKPEAKITGMNIAVINILGIVGLFVIPPIVMATDTSALEGGLLTGGTLQALGQAVAAGETISAETGLWATTIKLFRVSMLLPIAIIIALSFGKKSEGSTSLSLIPSFLWLFILTAILGYVDILPEGITSALHKLEKVLLTIAMAGIGWQIQFAKLKSEGPKRLVFGTVIFILQVLFMFLLIHLIHPQLEG